MLRGSVRVRVYRRLPALILDNSVTPLAKIRIAFAAASAYFAVLQTVTWFGQLTTILAGSPSGWTSSTLMVSLMWTWP
jgi:hypothetical protein